jgi:hypothetical protein
VQDLSNRPVRNSQSFKQRRYEPYNAKARYLNARSFEKGNHMERITQEDVNTWGNWRLLVDAKGSFLVHQSEARVRLFKQYGTYRSFAEWYIAVDLPLGLSREDRQIFGPAARELHYRRKP